MCGVYVCVCVDVWMVCVCSVYVCLCVSLYVVVVLIVIESVHIRQVIYV
mgnify:CR=1 FL=1